jgi:predicted TIM-barrel fold metal-dependent hydrolase
MAQTYTIIDADTHVVEPADLWTERAGADHATEVPHVIYNDARQRSEWLINDEFITLAPAGAVAGYSFPPPASPRTYAEAHPAAVNMADRLALMDSEGIWAAVLYPNVGGFGNASFLKIADSGLRLECVKAYNDFIAEWVRDSGGRFVGVCAVPFWDLAATLAEVERAAGLGHKGILFTGKPSLWWEQPHIADPYWYPLWELAESLRLPINFHAGGTDPALGWTEWGFRGMPARTRYTANSVSTFFGNAQSVCDVIFGGIPERFPELRMVLVECGIGWLPFLLECMDYQFMENRVRQASPELVSLPSEYFGRSFSSMFWFEEIVPARLLDFLGSRTVMFETDFPHPTSLWPPDTVGQRIERVFAGATREDRDNVLWRNAARLYRCELPPGLATREPDAGA